MYFDLRPHADSTQWARDIDVPAKATTVPGCCSISVRGQFRTLAGERNARRELERGRPHLATARNLAPGVNKIEIDFTAPIAPAGKAITRYEDKDDGSEYIYTLFVPMDASMAFPCFRSARSKGALHSGAHSSRQIGR